MIHCILLRTIASHASLLAVLGLQLPRSTAVEGLSHPWNLLQSIEIFYHRVDSFIFRALRGCVVKIKSLWTWAIGRLFCLILGSVPPKSSVHKLFSYMIFETLYKKSLWAGGLGHSDAD